jgi:hypothetical protein
MAPEGVRSIFSIVIGLSVAIGSALRPGGGCLGFLELYRAFLAADFDDLTADRDFDGVRVQRAVASRATFLNHGIFSSIIGNSMGRLTI